MVAVPAVRTLGVLVVAVVCLALAPAIAQAGVGAGGVVTFPGSGRVGDTGLPASITLVNFNSGDNQTDTNTVCNAGDVSPPCTPGEQGILLTPSCREVTGGQCTAADPGVFAVSATGEGRAGTACAGMTFAITPVNGSSFGTVRFTPEPVGAHAHVVLPQSQSLCAIQFTVDVLKSPSGDQNSAKAGIQTAQATEHTQYSVDLLSARALGSSSGTTVLPAPPPSSPPPSSTPPGSPPAGPPTTAAPPTSGLLPATAGSAKLSGKTGCQIKTFRADVRGAKIAKVVFTLDGRTILTLTKPNRNGRFSALVAPGKLGLGRHRIRARVTFATSATSPRTLSLVFVRCRRGAVAPRFTG